MPPVLPSNENAVPFPLSPLPYALLFLFLVLVPLHQFYPPLLSLHPELLLIGLILVTAGLEIFLFKSQSVSWDALFILLLCLLLVGAPLITSLMSTLSLEVVGEAEYKSWVKMLVVAPVIYLVFSGRRRETLVAALCAAIGILAIVFWYRYRVLGEVREFDARPLLQIKNGDPNFLCVLFGVGIPLALLKMKSELQKGQRTPAILYALLAFGFFASAVATESRMGLLAIGGGIFFLVLQLPSRVRRWGLLLLFLGATFALSQSSVWERFVHLLDRSNELRLGSMRAGLGMFASRPLFGHGWDSAPDHFFYYAGYPRLISETFPLEVHNTPLQILAELGLYGFALFMALFAFVGIKAFRSESKVFPFVTAALMILSFNLMTLPLQNKDFLVLLLVALASISAGPWTKFSSPTSR